VLPTKIYHFFWHLGLMLEYMTRAKLITWHTSDPVLRRRRQIKNTRRSALKFLRAFQIQVSVRGKENLAALHGQNYLLIANHVSYTDILVLSSVTELVFITSVEMGANFFLGDITRFGGSLFTDRKKPVSLPHEIKRFARTIAQGFNVVLFPEGTSTNGETVREFRSSLFQVAYEASCPVLPVCVKYHRLDGKPITSDNRDTVCWYGDMDFLPHFWKLLGHRIQVVVSILKPLPHDPKLRRVELSELVHRQLLACYHSFDSPVPETGTNPTKE